METPTIKLRVPKELEMFAKNGGSVVIQDGNCFGDGGVFIGPKPDLKKINFRSDTIVNDIKEASKKLVKEMPPQESEAGEEEKKEEKEETGETQVVFKPLSLESIQESTQILTPPPIQVESKKRTKKSKVEEVPDASSE